MFRNLRLKLTVFNIVVVGLILLFFVSGIYAMMARSISAQSDQLMRLIASDAGIGSKAKIPERQRHWSGYFYVRINANAHIIDVSPNPPISDEQLNTLISKAISLPKPRGEVNLNNEDSYRYLIAPQSNKQGVTIVFLSTQSESEMLHRLLVTLAIIGLIGLMFVFFGSFFMAEKALVPIKKSWQKQRDFVADASHELRTPLAVIQTNLELVMGNPDETVESQSKWLENIKSENTRMAKLVNDLLFLARTDSKQELLEMKHFPLHLAVEEALRPFEPVASAQHVSLESSIEHEITFYGDEARIKQLVVILIDNAIKYTSPDGKVILKLKDNINNIEIAVSDTGEGIEKAYIGKIFERFYRVDKARTRLSGGTGLGLSIAEWIVREHKGAISVTSLLKKGSTFLVSLPKQR